MTASFDGQENRRKPRNNKWSYIMPDFPGWDSLEVVARYHRWAEIIGIVVLALLVIAELISYRYGQRKDELTTQQQEATDQRHDEEMARLHLQTAVLTADAEKSRAAIAEATVRAAEANRKAEEERTARLKLLSEVSSRHINADSAKQLIDDLRGRVAHITVVKIYDQEAISFAIELINAFKAAGIETTDDIVPPPPLGYMTGICVGGRRGQRRRARGAPPRRSRPHRHGTTRQPRRSHPAVL
jgi:hypothetical protein